VKKENNHRGMRERAGEDREAEIPFSMESCVGIFF
jgi:hypothetical protein